MEQLYIKVNGEGLPVDHPHVKANLMQLYPDHDFSSGPPSGWSEFERVDQPSLGPYEKIDISVGNGSGVVYSLVDGVFKDVWHVVDMTAEEITEKQNAVKSQWAEMLATGNFTELNDWVFDEATCSYKAPA